VSAAGDVWTVGVTLVMCSLVWATARAAVRRWRSDLELQVRLEVAVEEAEARLAAEHTHMLVQGETDETGWTQWSCVCGKWTCLSLREPGTFEMWKLHRDGKRFIDG
jgi:hypothetical protein